MVRLRRTAPLAVVSLGLLLIAAGCGGSSNTSGTGSGGGNGSGSGGSGSGGSGGGGGSSTPTVSNFAVSPAVAAPGQFVNFTWTTTNATSISVNPSIVNSGQDDGQALPLQANPYTDTGIPTSTTTFQAVATSGTTNSQPASTTLTIMPVARECIADDHHSGQHGYFDVQRSE